MKEDEREGMLFVRDLLDKLDDQDEEEKEKRKPTSIFEFATDDLVDEFVEQLDKVERLKCNAHKLQLAIKDNF